MDYEKAAVNGAVGPRFVNPSVVARPDSEVATGKDTTPRYVGQFELLLFHRVILMIDHKSHGYFIDLLLKDSSNIFNEYDALHFVLWKIPKVSLA